MPGTRTAPAATAAATYKKLRYTMIDALGEWQSNSLYIDVAATAANIETFLAELQLRSNASLFEFGVESIWNGARQKSNALNAVFVQIEDNIMYSIREGVNTNQQVYLPAPLETQVVADTDTPDVTALGDWLAAILAIASTYSGRSVSFTRHKEVNSSNSKVTF